MNHGGGALLPNTLEYRVFDTIRDSGHFSHSYAARGAGETEMVFLHRVSLDQVWGGAPFFGQYDRSTTRFIFPFRSSGKPRNGKLFRYYQRVLYYKENVTFFIDGFRGFFRKGTFYGPNRVFMYVYQRKESHLVGLFFYFGTTSVERRHFEGARPGRVHIFRDEGRGQLAIYYSQFKGHLCVGGLG